MNQKLKFFSTAKDYAIILFEKSFCVNGRYISLRPFVLRIKDKNSRQNRGNEKLLSTIYLLGYLRHVKVKNKFLFYDNMCENDVR